jgi:hypothetical protein
LRPGENAAKQALKRIRDIERYYTDPPRIRWARAALSTARRRARRYTIPFGITLADVLGKATDRCPALGTVLDYSRGRLVLQADSATIDRVIPALGYVPENVVVVSAKANSCKGRCEPHEIMAVARWHGKQLAERGVTDG